MSIEDAFKIVVSGGIVAANNPLPELTQAKHIELSSLDTKRKRIQMEET